MAKIKYVTLLFLIIMSCSKDESISNQNLESYLTTLPYKTGKVIACAASAIDSDDVLVFYYPKPNAKHIKYYETASIHVDKFDFEKYDEIEVTHQPFFNGYLGVYNRISSKEKWIIITFEMDGEIHVSNPIHTKQYTKPTFWTDIVSIDQSILLMPNFSWDDNLKGDNAIYFQVVSDNENNLLSGTYTYQNHFQYYNTSNVILNVTEKTPPDLEKNKTYNFTLMDVSEDNWVNLIIQKEFTVK